MSLVIVEMWVSFLTLSIRLIAIRFRQPNISQISELTTM